MNYSRAALLAVVLVSLLATPIASTALAAEQQNAEINYDSSLATDSYVYEEQVTITQHNRSEMDGPLHYYGDDGTVKELPAALNGSVDNPIGYEATKVADDSLSIFPRKGEANNDASALDASEWTADESSTAGSASVSTTTTAGTVDGVQLSTSSQGSGDRAVFTYDNFTIDSDAKKRVPLFVANINTLDAGATVDVNLTAADGDVKTLTIDTGANADDAGTIANTTGDSVIYQERLSELATHGSGDGSFDSIESVDVEVVDADAEVVITGFDLERKSKMAFGTWVDDDGDTTTWYQNPDGGELRVESIDSLPSEWSDATIYDMDVHGLEYRASYQPASDVVANFTTAPDYPDFNNRMNLYQRLEVPAAIDLSHQGLELRDEQAHVADRYQKYAYAKGTGSTAPDNFSSWTDASGQLADKGETLTLSSAIQPGQSIVFTAQPLLTGSEADELRTLYTDSDKEYEAGAGTGPVSSGGGLIDSLLGIPGMIIAGIAGFLGLRARSNSGA